MLNHDNVISSPKIDLLIEEFIGELALLAPIPPGIVEANLDPKEDIRFIENLMYDNSFPRPPKTLKDDSKTVIDSNNDYSSSDDDSYEGKRYDILREKLLNVNLLIAKIGALKDNPTPSSDFMTKSSSTSPNFFLEETNTFDNSLPRNLKLFALIWKRRVVKMMLVPQTQLDFSQYDSFIFDLSINPFPPADRSDSHLEEFADKLAHIISPPEYDCFY
ncbi:hypothetical protein Tco_0841817 [Tanacetum coccineum]|uniref:Reverse transcriptase domain-containing protein n=1 Tax=Tanacetum coccineum TaxID=301880 RepID=A0ABQ5AXH1_9ASTR